MKNSEKFERLYSAYTDVVRTIGKIHRKEQLGEFVLLNAVSNLQIILMEGFKPQLEENFLDD